MSLGLKSLELFVRVAALGGIAKAGQEFGFSGTTASQRIPVLEAQLDCKILNRTTRSVSLSADGEVFLAHAKKTIASVEDTLADNDLTVGSNLVAKSAIAVSGRQTFQSFMWVNRQTNNRQK